MSAGFEPANHEGNALEAFGFDRFPNPSCYVFVFIIFESQPTRPLYHITPLGSSLQRLPSSSEVVSLPAEE